MNLKDIEILRELGKQTAEIAALPIQKKRKELWIKLNALEPERPMFTIDQVPWHEMNVDGELNLFCKDPFARSIEDQLRKQLYKWKYMQDDLVIEEHINIPMAINGLTYGLDIDENLAFTDEDNDIVSHSYEDQLKTEEDLEKIKFPTITLNKEETSRRAEIAHAAFDSILEVRMNGFVPNFAIWDRIVEWRGFDSMLLDMYDRPEFLHKTMERLTNVTISMLDQLEAQGLLEQPQATIHCSGAWVDDLPQAEKNDHPKAKELWTYGQAQIFSTVSPEMHEEFDIQYAKRWFERFGLGYYGCCEPLDNKIHIVRKLPNIRKIAMSPWADIERGAAEIGKDYVLSSKPSPSHLAVKWNPKAAQEEMDKLLAACAKYGTPCEFLLKDISTVEYKPSALWEWADIVRNAIN